MFGLTSFLEKVLSAFKTCHVRTSRLHFPSVTAPRHMITYTCTLLSTGLCLSLSSFCCVTPQCAKYLVHFVHVHGFRFSRPLFWLVLYLNKEFCICIRLCSAFVTTYFFYPLCKIMYFHYNYQNEGHSDFKGVAIHSCYDSIPFMIRASQFDSVHQKFNQETLCLKRLCFYFWIINRAKDCAFLSV